MRRNIFFLILTIVLISCNKSPRYSTSIPDYSKNENWLDIPYSIEKWVDVFYVYPTVSSNPSGSMDITDENERSLAQGIYNAQASIFEGTANIFAPYYRQMSTMVSIPEDSDIIATDTEEFQIGAADVINAFEDYMKNRNNGRAFILAGHSQGTMALIEVIKNSIAANADLRKRMIVAYLIGYTITEQDLRDFKINFAKGETDSNCIVSYNTQAVNSGGGPMLLDSAKCINPLNWKIDETEANNTENLGARFYNDSTGDFLLEMKNVCGARVNSRNGALEIIPRKDIKLSEIPYGDGVYHRFDYALFYRNIEKNVKIRCESYLKNMNE